jgi:hypothetical protein
MEKKSTDLEERSEHSFVKGDHLIVTRSGYKHHGIYCGDGQVIHFAETSDSTLRNLVNMGDFQIKMTPLTEFQRSGKISVINHKKSLDPDEVINRAKSKLSEKDYNLLFNNCEHFAYWAKTGKKDSKQVTKGFLISGGLTALFMVGGIAGAKLHQNYRETHPPSENYFIF